VSERAEIAEMLRRRAANEAPNAAAALAFMAGVIEENRPLPEFMLGQVSETDSPEVKTLKESMLEDAISDLRNAGMVVMSRDLAESMVEEDECSWDHNHSCQAHGYFYLPQGAKCPQAELKELLA
jgi:threonine synthase